MTFPMMVAREECYGKNKQELHDSTSKNLIELNVTNWLMYTLLV